MSSASTVGYGDFSAKTFSGRTSTIILLFILGVATLAQESFIFEHRREVRKQMLTGDWRWTAKNHIVFMNCPKEWVKYFYHAILVLRKQL